MTQTITNVPQLKFNKMSNEKYQELLAKGELVANEFYITPDTINGEEVPTKVSQLENDLGFITSEDIDLNNYHTKEEVNTLISSKADKETTYTKEEVDALLNERFKIVDELPENPDPNVFYFVKE